MYLLNDYDNIKKRNSKEYTKPINHFYKNDAKVIYERGYADMFDEEKLKTIIQENIKILDKSQVIFGDDLNFEQDLGMGSIEMVEILVEIEGQYNIEFDYDYISDVISSYGSLKSYIKTKLGDI